MLTETIITGVIGLIGSLLTFYVGKRKSNAEARKSEISNEMSMHDLYSDSLKKMHDLMETYTSTFNKNQELQKENSRLSSKIELLTEEIAELRKEIREMKADERVLSSKKRKSKENENKCKKDL